MKSNWHSFSRSDNFSCYPPVQLIIILSYEMLIKYILVSKQSRPGECLSLYFVLRTFKRSVRIYSVDIFLVNHPSSSNINCCQFPSRVRAWFHGSAGDKCLSANQNQLFYLKTLCILKSQIQTHPTEQGNFSEGFIG